MEDLSEVLSLDAPVTPRKMKLRRLTTGIPPFPESSEIIQKNLEPLKANLIKKKWAQDHYYQNAGPVGNSPMIRPLGKPSVKQRLGRVPYFGTNTAMVPPKNFRKPNVTQNRVINRRMNFSQQRLYTIRQNQHQRRFTLNRSVNNNMKLSNFKVEVQNNRSYQMYTRVRRFKQILDHRLKHEIEALQKNLPIREILDITEIMPVTTKITLHQRFASLI